MTGPSHPDGPAPTEGVGALDAVLAQLQPALAEAQARLTRQPDWAPGLPAAVVADLIEVVALDGTVLFAGNSGLLPPDAAEYADQPLEYWLQQGSAEARNALDAASAGLAVQFEEVAPARTGEMVRWGVTVTPLCTAYGEVDALLVVSRDRRSRRSDALERDSPAGHIGQAATRAGPAPSRDAEALRVTTERLDLALDAGPVLGTWVWDVAAGWVVADARLARAISADPSPAELVLPVEGFLATIDPADRPAVTRQIDQATRNGGRFEVQYRMVRPDGSVRWVQASGHCDLDAAGQPVRVPGVLVDVHDRVEAELAVAAKVSRQAALIRLGDQLRDAADLAVISDLAAAAGEALGLNNLGYVEVDPQHGGLTVLQDGSTVGAPGRFEPSAFPSVMHRLQRGAAVVEADLAATEWLGPGERDALQALGIQALVNVPLMRDGQLVGAMFAGSPTPRAWSDDEVRFIHDVADRTWAASERVQVETALRASAAELQLVADSMPVLITMIDRSLVYRFVNRASVDWFGVPPEAVIGVPARDVLGTEGFAWRHPYFAAALAGQASKVEAEWPHPDGRPRTAEISYLPRRAADGTTDGLYSLVVDVTERKRAEQVLQLSAEALEAEVARRTAERDRMWTLSTDIMLVASFDGAIEAVNPAWSSLLGWPAAELIGSNFFDLVHPEDLENTRAEAVLLSQGRRTITFENRYRHRDGSYRWISWSAAPGEQLIHAAGRDITEERERQALQRSLEEQLRQSQKMEAVGQLTGGLAHDFNNLLTAITGSLEMLQVRIAQGRTDDIERYATVARGAASRAAALTHRLLAFSRRQTLDPKPTQINRLVADMEDLIKRTVGPAIHLETVLGVGLWLTLCDQNQLENALLNLCINARDAMAAGGRLTVETANVWLDERGAQERDMIPGQYVGLSVTDSGTGMTPDVAARAFDPFFTTKPMGEGTGLGLSMIYGFVRQSGGQVRIYSELGHGSTIQLYLPRHHAEVQPDVELTPAEAPRAEQGETVLVVDDEPTIRLLVGEVLGELGYGAIEASDGPSALAVLQSGHRIDLMITDVGLPGGMNGRQLADAARQWRPALKVLFITGYAANGAVGNGYLQPGMHVMTKPFAMDALAVKIRTVIAG